MSAYIVDRNHITFLLTKAKDYRMFDGPGVTWNGKTRTEVGNMLWMFNIEAVAHLYHGEPIRDLPGPGETDYRFFYPDVTPTYEADAVQVLMSIACYRYQACEHPDWRWSEAERFCDQFMNLAMHHLRGWDSKIWGAPEPLQGVISLSDMMRKPTKRTPAKGMRRVKR